jgi:hypothetical protein
MDYAKTERDRQALELIFAPQVTAWPLIAPPGVSADRLAVLRKAFDDTMKDKAFVADADKLRIDVEPVQGVEMQKIIQRISGFDRSVIDRALELTAAN